MKMKTRPYLMKIAISNVVRFAIDDIRARNPLRLDEDLLGDVVRRGVKAMLDEAEENESPKVLAFSIPSDVNHRLEMFLSETPGEREDLMSRLLEIGLDAARRNPSLLDESESEDEPPAQKRAGFAVHGRRR